MLIGLCRELNMVVGCKRFIDLGESWEWSGERVTFTHPHVATVNNILLMVSTLPSPTKLL